MSKLGETVCVIAAIVVIAVGALYVSEHISCIKLPFTTACLFK
mgnify:CR=1 FL=1